EGPDEIRIAEGVYKPTFGGDRLATFELADGVTLLGGYAANPNNPDQRNTNLFETVLSGDIGAPGVGVDNSYNVVTIVDASAALDGVTITGGNALDSPVVTSG